MPHAYRLVSGLSPLIFRAYDIRGVVDDTLTPDGIYTIACALGSEIQAQHQSQVIIARDGRLSGPIFVEALKQGLLDTGCDVIDLGMTPTPVLYYATHALGIPSGIMLTGSHNPVNHNGLKMVIDGETLSADRIQALYQRIIDQDFVQGQGDYREHDVIPQYLDRITQDVRLARPLNVVIDAGNGVSGPVITQLLERLGCDVTALYCDIDGNFPNHHPDPSVPENLTELIASVKANNADIGFALDGDGDRLGIVTNTGEIIWPDRQLMLFAIDVLSRHPGATIVYDVKCSWHLAQIISQHNGQPLMWKTGHSILKAKMHEVGSPLSGEMSGHLFFGERWYGFDDGLYTAARLLELLAKSKGQSDRLFAEIPNSINTPELKIPLAEDQKFQFMAKFIEQAAFPEAKINTIDGIRVDFTDGWGLLRPSNTTPYLVARFEADTEVRLKSIQAQFREQLLALDPDLSLPF